LDTVPTEPPAAAATSFIPAGVKPPVPGTVIMIPLAGRAEPIGTGRKIDLPMAAGSVDFAFQAIVASPDEVLKPFNPGDAMRRWDSGLKPLRVVGTGFRGPGGPPVTAVAE
jgi:hypothetical protein